MRLSRWRLAAVMLAVFAAVAAVAALHRPAPAPLKMSGILLTIDAPTARDLQRTGRLEVKP